MLDLSAGPDERRLDSAALGFIAERKGVSLAPRTAVEISLVLLPEPRSCGLARNAVRDFCRAQGMSELSEDAALLTSELVGNAVEHAGWGATPHGNGKSVWFRLP